MLGTQDQNRQFCARPDWYASYMVAEQSGEELPQ